jgi:hypothetical protein
MHDSNISFIQHKQCNVMQGEGSIYSGALQLLREIQGLALYSSMVKAVEGALQCRSCSDQIKNVTLLAERMTVFLLLAPAETWDNIADRDCQVPCHVLYLWWRPSASLLAMTWHHKNFIKCAEGLSSYVPCFAERLFLQ